MAGLGAKDILRNITALEQLIEEINFQRAKEMRQCLMSKDSDTGFVMVHGTTYWTDLFVRHFLFQTDRSTDADDLLFFIRKKQLKGSRYIPRYQTEVEVYRKDSRKLPIGDPDIDWEETVYLNLIIHQFDYTLTLAVCTRTSPKELQVLKRHSQKVYASPSKRRMDTKGEVEEITYPNVCFHVDNFDEVFADMLVRDGEMVCVELVASDHSGSRQAVIFLGSIRYDALKRVYDARASMSSKMAQRMMMGLFSGGSSQRIEFVRMKGPQGKGHAEMAVSKPTGSGVETPTSEPGVSLTDLWDSDWEDEPEDRFLYRHQRRLSDPSANFNTFINSGWASRAEVKSRSENEGLDNFANGLYEIESGDVRDESCSACKCCAMVACGSQTEDDLAISIDGYCYKCKHIHSTKDMSVPVDKNSKKINLKEKHCSLPSNVDKETSFIDERLTVQEDFEVVEAVEALEDLNFFPSCDSCSNLNNSHNTPNIPTTSTCTCQPSGLIKEDSPTTSDEDEPFLDASSSFNHQDLEDYDDGTISMKKVTSLPKDNTSKTSFYSRFSLKSKKKSMPGVAVRVEPSLQESIPASSKDAPHGYMAVPTKDEDQDDNCNAVKKRNNFFPNKNVDFSEQEEPSCSGQNNTKKSMKKFSSGPLYYRSRSMDVRKLERFLEMNSEKLTRSKSCDFENMQEKKFRASVPFRVTKDGTKVFFMCDVKLDDGAYNPLWTTKGFTQTFHFWKESRRAQSVPLNAYLTYVTLPWFTIITDILDHRTGPILTF